MAPLAKPEIMPEIASELPTNSMPGARRASGNLEVLIKSYNITDFKEPDGASIAIAAGMMSNPISRR